MANFTITDRTLNYNSSALSTFVNNDSFILNNSTLIIDSDNRWGYNGSVFNNIVMSASLGGSTIIDGTKVWEVPFSSSTGTVPKLSSIENTLIPVSGLTSGAYGELLGVWNNTSLTPQASSTTLPQQGFIKLRSKTGNFISGEQILLSNGSNITASSSGNRSWINVAGRAQASIQGYSLLTTLSCIGDWYYLEKTNGLYNQIIKIPVADNINGLWIESFPNSNIYEHWMNASSTWGLKNTVLGAGSGSFVYGTENQSGRVFSCNSENATITFAYSGVDGKFGYLPPAGCKIRIPNILASSAGNGTPRTSESQKLTTGNGLYSENVLPQGQVKFNIASQTLQYSIKNVNLNWAVYHIVDGFYNLENCGLLQPMRINLAQSLKIIDCISSPISAMIGNNYGNNSPKRNHFLGCDKIEIDNFSGIGCTTAGNATYGTPLTAGCGLIQADDSGVISFKNIYAIQPCFLFGTATDNISILTNIDSGYLENITCVGADALYFTTVKNIRVKNFYGSQGVSYPFNPTGEAYNAFSFSASNNIFVDGVSGIPSLEASVKNVDGISTSFHKELFYASNVSDNIEMRNVGTKLHPLTAYTSSTDYGQAPSNAIYDAYNIKLRNIHLVTKKLFRNATTSSNTAGKQARNILIENVYNYPSNFRNVFNLNITNNFENVSYRDCTFRGTMGIPITATSFITNGEIPGTHWQDYFLNTTQGYIYLQANKPSPQTDPFITQSYNPNGIYKAGFTGDGKLNLPNVNDNVIWETPYYILGHTGFENVTPVIRAAGSTNLLVTFQYDNTKNGYNGNWLTLNAQTLSGINIVPSTGIKLKIKIQTITTSASNSFYSLYLTTKTDSESQQIQYPLPKANKGVISNLITNSRVQIYNETTGQELYNDIHQVVGDLEYEYNDGEGITVGDILRIRITYINGSTAKLRQELKTIATVTGFVAFADQEDDKVYNQNAIDGTSVTEFGADYPNIEVDINDPDQQTSIPRLYAWWVANEYTEDGIANYFEGIIAEDFANYRVITQVVQDFKIDNLSNQGVVFLGNYRLYRDDGGIPVVTTTTGGGSIILYAGNVNITTIDRDVPSLSPQDSATLNKINTLPQDTFNLKLSAITMEDTIGMRLKNSSTVSNVGQIITDALSI
jgi:hypothetical protein